MNNNTQKTDFRELVGSQFVELSEVIRLLADSNGWDDIESNGNLLTFELPALFPIWVENPPDFSRVDDTACERVIEYKLKAIPWEMLSENERYTAVYCEIYWSIGVLYPWCKKRKLEVPKPWNEWIKNTYPILRGRELVDEIPDYLSAQTPEQRRLECWIIFNQEKLEGGEWGAQTRTAKRLGVNRQIVGRLLKRYEELVGKRSNPPA